MFTGDDASKFDHFFEDLIGDPQELLNVFFGVRVEERTQLHIALGCMGKKRCRDPLGLEDVLDFEEEIGHSLGLDREVVDKRDRFLRATEAD